MRSIAPSLAAIAFSLFTLGSTLGCETAPAVSPDPAAKAAEGPGKAAEAARPAAQAKNEAPADQAAKKTFGDPVSTTSEKVSLQELLKNPARYGDRTIRTEGRVSAVCQSRGCWLELEDEGGMAHVKLGAHKFFVPKDSTGKHAVVEGKVFQQVAKGHCEQEAEEQTGKSAKVELDATGVELVASR